MPRSLRLNQYTDMADKNQSIVLVQLKLDFYNTCEHVSTAEIVLGGISQSDTQTMW